MTFEDAARILGLPPTVASFDDIVARKNKMLSGMLCYITPCHGWGLRENQV
jgi:hypothetical protein